MVSPQGLTVASVVLPSRYKATIEDFTESGYLIKYDDFEDKEEVSSEFQSTKNWLVPD